MSLVDALVAYNLWSVMHFNYPQLVIIYSWFNGYIWIPYTKDAAITSFRQGLNLDIHAIHSLWKHLNFVFKISLYFEYDTVSSTSGSIPTFVNTFHVHLAFYANKIRNSICNDLIVFKNILLSIFTNVCTCVRTNNDCNSHTVGFSLLTCFWVVYIVCAFSFECVSVCGQTKTNTWIFSQLFHAKGFHFIVNAQNNRCRCEVKRIDSLCSAKRDEWFVAAI